VKLHITADQTGMSKRSTKTVTLKRKGHFMISRLYTTEEKKEDATIPSSHIKLSESLFITAV